MAWLTSEISDGRNRPNRKVKAAKLPNFSLLICAEREKRKLRGFSLCSLGGGLFDFQASRVSAMQNCFGGTVNVAFFS